MIDPKLHLKKNKTICWHIFRWLHTCSRWWPPWYPAVGFPCFFSKISVCLCLFLDVWQRRYSKQLSFIGSWRINHMQWIQTFHIPWEHLRSWMIAIRRYELQWLLSWTLKYAFWFVGFNFKVRKLKNYSVSRWLQ